MVPSSRSSYSPTFRRGGTMQASELSRKLRDEVRRSPRVAARFADLLRASAGNLAILELEPTLRVTLNPIRAWLHESAGAAFPGVVAAEPDGATHAATEKAGQPINRISERLHRESPGVDVVLFAVGEEVRTFAATMPERALLHHLAEIGPATLAAWLAHDSKLGRLGATRTELLSLVRSATAAGLTAVS